MGIGGGGWEGALYLAVHTYTSRFLLTGYIDLCKLGVLWRVCYSYSMHCKPVTVAAAYPQSTSSGTPTYSSLSSTVSCKTFVAGRLVSGKNLIWMCKPAAV